MRDGLVREEADRSARYRAVAAGWTDAKQHIPRDLLCDDAAFRNAVIAQQHLARFDGVLDAGDEAVRIILSTGDLRRG